MKAGIILGLFQLYPETSFLGRYLFIDRTSHQINRRVMSLFVPAFKRLGLIPPK